jgi:predicted ATP-grasp superfamily ATP-dependent carboligase
VAVVRFPRLANATDLDPLYLEPGVEPDRDAIRAEMGHEPLVQEYIPGTEHAFWALYDHGEPVATCQRNRVRGFKYSGSASIYRESVRIPELEAAGRALLDALDWHGLASAQFMRNERTGEFTLMEINPRFWLSLPCAIQAGADFANYYWRLAGGEPIRIDSPYEAGVGTHLLRGEASHLHSILREDYAFVPRPSFSATLREVARSLYEQPHFDLLSLDDPGPFVRDFRNSVTSVL